MKVVDQGSFPVAEIVVKNRLRSIDWQWVEGLAAIIGQAGILQHPIQLMRQGNELRLIAGAHRLAAFQKLERHYIQAVVYEAETDNPELEIKLHEIIENIARRELSALDRASHIAELKNTYQALYGATHGGDRKSKKAATDQSANIALWSLGDEVAAKMGLSKRTIFADAALYAAFSPSMRKQLSLPAYQWLADNRSQLVALSKEAPESQHVILNYFNGEESDPPNINAAVALFHNKVDTTTPDEKHFAAFVKLVAKSSKKVRKQMASYLTKEAA